MYASYHTGLGLLLNQDFSSHSSWSLSYVDGPTIRQTFASSGLTDYFPGGPGDIEQPAALILN
jgi:hypothetical protein